MEEIKKEEMLDFEDTDLDNTGAKKSSGTTKRVVSWILILSLGIGAVAGGAFGYKKLREHIENTNTVKRTTSIVSLYTERDVCSLDETIYSSLNYDSKICDGKVLVDVLNQQGVKYCEVLDEYYTNDGRDIAIVTVEITRDDWVDPTAITDDVKGSNVDYFTLPEGYVLKDGRGYRQVVETKEIVTEVRKNGDYDKMTINGIPGKITQVIDAKTVKTKSFDDIINAELVCDVKDDYATAKNGSLSEATYRLIPKSN